MPLRGKCSVSVPFTMLFMESYVFCASLRLGVIVISVFASAKSIIIMYVIAKEGIDFMYSLIAKFDKNVNYRNSYYMVRDTVFWLDSYPELVSFLLQIYSFCHLASCAMAAYGAYKLKRFFVIPLAIFEFVYLVEIVIIFTLFLRIIRHFVSLEKLILLTLLSTAYSVLVLYDFFALVAFEQVMHLVKSKKYQQIYGTDPLKPKLKPIIMQNTGKLSEEIVYVMPKANFNFPPKWWQVDSAKIITNKENIILDEAHKHFQAQELLAAVLLHNGINIGYTQKKRVGK